MNKQEQNPVVEDFHTNENKIGEWAVVRLRGRVHDSDKEEGRITWIDFEIYPIPGIEGDAPIFWATEDFEMFGQNGGVTKNLDEAKPSITGFVKGDGCTQLWFHDSPLHVDHEDQLEAVFTAIREARKHAIDQMEKTGGTW